MRRAIANGGFAKTNDVLVMVHAVNFIVWCLLETTETILFNTTQGENPHYSLKVAFGLVEQLIYVYETYINCFLVYLISRFAVENKNAEVRDPILGKKVPNLVFL